MSLLPELPSVRAIQGRLARIFPEGVPDRGYFVRDLAAKTVFAAIYVGAAGDPDADGARLIRPSTVCWMSDAAAARRDEPFRIDWHAAALSGRAAVEAHLDAAGLPRETWYRDNTREPIRDEILRPWQMRYGAVLRRRGIPMTSSKPTMTLASDFAGLFDPDLAGGELDRRLAAWREAHLSAMEQARLRARTALAVEGEIMVRLPGRGDRRLPPGESSALTKAAVERLAPRLLREPYVLAIAHGGDPTSDADRRELAMYGLDLASSPALPDLILVDADSGAFWFVEVVVTDGEIDESRRAALTDWALAHGVLPQSCRFVTVFGSRTAQVFRRSVAALAWDTMIWLADEPDRIVRLDALPEDLRRADAAK